MTYFRTFPHRETYTKLIFLKKAIFLSLNQFFATTRNNVTNRRFWLYFRESWKKKFKSCKILLHLYLLFLKSIRFCMFIIQNSWHFFFLFHKISQWNSIFSCKFKSSPLCMNEEKWNKFWVVYICYRIILEQCVSLLNLT